MFPTQFLLLDLALKVLALDQLGDLVVVVLALAALGLGHGLVALGELAERGQGVGAELVEDAGHELGELLVLAVAVDGKGVGGDRGVDCCGMLALSGSSFSGDGSQLDAEVRTLGGLEVDDVAVLLEHVDLLDALDGLGVELLQGLEELLVVGTGAGRTALGSTTGGTLATAQKNLDVSKLLRLIR